MTCGRFKLKFLPKDSSIKSYILLILLFVTIENTAKMATWYYILQYDAAEVILIFKRKEKMLNQY